MKSWAGVTLCLFALGTYPAQAKYLEYAQCLCGVYIPKARIEEGSALSALHSWVDLLKSNSHSTYNYYVGMKPINEHFGPLPSIRVLVILPSEYIRDSSLEWDAFEVVISASDLDGGVWLSTENYRYRAKGLLSSASPSSDWEYSSLNDNSTSNVRLRQAADALKHGLETTPGAIKTQPEPAFGTPGQAAASTIYSPIP